ncbi:MULTISPECIES: carbonic anhydrase [unclassified Desulfosporosinus]|uniref:carbonic anhydrase n=1 Tax=unclassified Desulfosporosinus TaxID=2633794 RepID=UPI000223AF5C|nr:MULTISPECIES: carbonic anhydrase [unclassified Desulfosporosinus]EGW38252.1 carbonic anhydrase family protein [Desulfosporosinus sp. OT]ODA41967.1 Carbonic anhydrase [Desulfosporosinus sp. BG]
MQNLVAGLIKFRTQDYEEHKNLFCRLKRRQEPHTLFIACSDSRVVPELITKSLPGELFVVRNIANIVPKYKEAHEYVATTSATTAAIEYAIKVLKVKNIIICGHSNCGGCSSIYLPDAVLNEMPATKKWLEVSGNVKKRVMEEIDGKDLEMREWLTEHINIVEQIKHLLTYPYVEEKYNKRELDIMGMYYRIETGEVFIFNAQKSAFELAN